MNQFTKKELTALYWLLSELRYDQDLAKWDVDSLINKISTEWNHAQ